MKIAVASGKGGTGKTMVATSLADSLAPIYSLQLLDCDVEAPNAHLFLKPVLKHQKPAVIPIPEIDADVCTTCGTCVNVCQYHALAMIHDQVLVFPQLCHGCGSCTLNCPVNAISEISNTIGSLHWGMTDSGIRHLMGVLTVSEPMPTPIIHQLKQLTEEKADITVFDSPPGASCAVVATIYDADYVLLVTESTPFGLHDLKQMLGIISTMGKPAGVIINRQGIGDEKSLTSFLQSKSIPILMSIPYQSEIAVGLASGKILTESFPAYKKLFIELYETIHSTVDFIPN